MNGWGNIIVAGIGALAAIAGSYFTAQSAADIRVSEVNTEVKVLSERQALQYQEIKASVDRIETKLDKALK